MNKFKMRKKYNLIKELPRRKRNRLNERCKKEFFLTVIN